MEKIDSIDLKMLTVLQKDGGISQRDLAEQVGLSQNACWRRLQRLGQLQLVLCFDGLAGQVECLIQLGYLLGEEVQGGFQLEQAFIGFGVASERVVSQLVGCVFLGGGAK